jgi:endonuclease YncB( thermonuclease family)
MPIYPTGLAIERQIALAEKYGVDGCITEQSVWLAVMDSYQGDTTVKSTDLEWLYASPGFCIANQQHEGLYISRIIDGDTYELIECAKDFCATSDLLTYIVRLWNTSCAEAGTGPGDDATAYVSELLPIGTQISFQQKGLDSYKRKVGIVFLSTLNVNDDLIQKGYAAPWTPNELLLFEQTQEESDVVDNKLAVPQFTGNFKIPDPIIIGKKNKFGAELKNVGTAIGSWWMSIRLVAANGEEYTHSGSSTYTKKYSPGEIGFLNVIVNVPNYLSGKITPTFRVNE